MSDDKFSTIRYLLFIIQYLTSYSTISNFAVTPQHRGLKETKPLPKFQVTYLLLTYFLFCKILQTFFKILTNLVPKMNSQFQNTKITIYRPSLQSCRTNKYFGPTFYFFTFYPRLRLRSKYINRLEPSQKSKIPKPQYMFVQEVYNDGRQAVLSNAIYYLLLMMRSAHRVTIERTSLSKETYTAKYPRKIFPSFDVFRVVDACMGFSG